MTPQSGKWRSPGQRAVVWLALAALVVVTALGPAPAVVPTALGAALLVAYLLVYGRWDWKQSRTFLRISSPFDRVAGFFGYGATRADLVLRPHLALRVIMWPLLPLTMYYRVELRAGELRSFGNPLQTSPVAIDHSTDLRLARDQRFVSPLRNYYRVLTVTHPLGGRIRLCVVLWSGWRRLARTIDPTNRIALDLTSWSEDIASSDRP